jgi:hypothetical protein
MQPKEMRRRALEVLDKVADQCPKELDLLLVAKQLIIAADDLEEMSTEKTKRGTIVGKRVGEEPADE